MEIALENRGQIECQQLGWTYNLLSVNGILYLHTCTIYCVASCKSEQQTNNALLLSEVFMFSLWSIVSDTECMVVEKMLLWERLTYIRFLCSLVLLYQVPLPMIITRKHSSYFKALSSFSLCMFKGNFIPKKQWLAHRVGAQGVRHTNDSQVMWRDSEGWQRAVLFCLRLSLERSYFLIW